MSLDLTPKTSHGVGELLSTTYRKGRHSSFPRESMALPEVEG